MSPTSEAIQDGLEQAAEDIKGEPGRSPVKAGNPFIAKVTVPATMEVLEGPLSPAPTHTVREGETLSSIAEQHGTTWQELAKLNDLDDPDTIHPGQVLTLPSEEGDNSTATTVEIESEVSWRIDRLWQGARRRARKGRDFVVLKESSNKDGDVMKHTVEALLAPAVVAMTEPPTRRPTKWLVEAAVKLTAKPPVGLGEPAPDTERDLVVAPEIEVTALEVPTVLVVFSEVEYGLDGGRLVIVPTNGAVQFNEGIVDDFTELVNTLNEVHNVIKSLKKLGRFAAWSTGLPTGWKDLVDVLSGPVTGGHKSIFASRDQCADLGDKDEMPEGTNEWRNRPVSLTHPSGDDHGAEDDIDSLLMVSVDQRLELFEDANFKDTKVEVDPSPSQFWIGIKDFHDVKKVEPANARVKPHPSDVTDFSDQTHSLRFRPRIRR